MLVPETFLKHEGYRQLLALIEALSGRLSLFQSQWLVWSLGIYESKTLDYISWHQKASTGSLGRAGRRPEMLARMKGRSVQGSFCCSFSWVPLSNCSLTLVALSEGKWCSELNQTTGSFQRQRSTTCLPLTTDKSQLIGAQLFSRVPSGLSQGKFLDLYRGFHVACHASSHIFTRALQSLFGVLNLMCWPGFEVNVDQRLHIPAIISLTANTGD